MPARLAAALFGVWMAALGVTFAVAPALQTPVGVVAGVSAALAVAAGVRRHRPARSGPWRLLAVTVVLSTLGTAMTRPAGDAPPWLPGAGDLVLLALYPLHATVLFLFSRSRTGGARDRGGM